MANPFGAETVDYGTVTGQGGFRGSKFQGPRSVGSSEPLADLRCWY